jgi:hypothetical protein
VSPIRLTVTVVGRRLDPEHYRLRLTSFVCRAAGSTIGPREFPAFAVGQRSILGYLERAGLELEDVELRSAPSKDPASSPGYEDLLFVSGRLAG